MNRLTELLQSSKTILLDGAIGTELTRRGFDVDRPGWSANAIVEAPLLLEEIHREYVAAGAQVITASTFRTHRRNLSGSPYQGRDVELTAKAVEIARWAAGNSVLVAGSISPLGDCYLPEDRPPMDVMFEEHWEQVDKLTSAGVDLLLLETMNNIEETVIAVSSASRSGLPFVLSLIVQDEGHLLSGESLEQTMECVLTQAVPSAVCLNCVHPQAASGAIGRLKTIDSEIPLGFYGNTHHWTRFDREMIFAAGSGLKPKEYAVEVAALSRQFDLKIIGGCCGTTPEHISAVRQLLINDEEPDSRVAFSI